MSHGASRYVPMTYFDSLADARKTLRENSLLALETQIDLLDWLHTPVSALAYTDFMKVYGYKKLTDDSQRETLGIWLRDRVRKTLSTASTYYVSPDMCEMIRMAAEAMPPEALSPKDLPTPVGFLFFSRPMIIDGPGDDPDETVKTSVSAVVWEDGIVGHPQTGSQPGVSYWLFQNPNDAAAYVNRLIVQDYEKVTGQQMPEPVTVVGDAPPGSPLASLLTESEMRDEQGPLPIYDFSGWTYGTQWNTVKSGLDLLVAEDGRGVTAAYDQDGALNVHPVVDQARRMMLATWRMLGEKITVLDEERPPRFIRRRAERRMPENGDIVVVRLRKETHGQLVIENPEEGPWYSHRFLVRGHWHTYWVGARGSQSKSIQWVAPYIRGPEGTPLVIKDKISALER